MAARMIASLLLADFRVRDTGFEPFALVVVTVGTSF
jgi:hypothetical protein